jgi:cell division protein FtsW
MNFVNKIFRGDRIIWMIFFFLCFISILEIFSATSTLTYKKQNYWDPVTRHTVFLLAGTAVVLLIHSLKPKYLSIFIVGLPFTWLLLILTRLFGTYVNGAHRLIELGGLSFQPSELAKLCLIVFTAFVLSKTQEAKKNVRFKWIVYITIITCGTILTENLSTAVLLYVVVVLMMFVGQIPTRQMLWLVLVSCVVALLFIVLLHGAPKEMFADKNSVFHRASTWKTRIDDFWVDKQEKNRETFDVNDNYQVSHAKIAIARGKIFGVFFGNSQERDYLPQAYSDFIYAIIIEEIGIAGGIFVLALYVFLFIRAGTIANRCQQVFPKLLVIGSALIIVLQAFINMAVAVNLIPVTGQPLPLISRGGTSTLITCVYMGIILSVSRFENPKGIQREQEIAEENETATVEKLWNEDLNIEDSNIQEEKQQ